MKGERSKEEREPPAFFVRPMTVADLGAVYSLAKHTELYLTVDNLSNARVEISRSADDVIYIASPRMTHGGIRLSW